MYQNIYGFLISDSFLKFAPIVFSVISGGVAGAIVTRVLNQNREKKVLSFELHREFNNVEMSIHRRKALNFLKQHLNTSYTELTEKDNEGSISAFVVMRFFQRLSSSVKYNQIKAPIIIDLFSEIFYYWFYISFKNDLLTTDWEAGRQINYLAEWFKDNLPKSAHGKLVEDMILKREIFVKKYTSPDLTSPVLSTANHNTSTQSSIK